MGDYSKKETFEHQAIFGKNTQLLGTISRRHANSSIIIGDDCSIDGYIATEKHDSNLCIGNNVFIGGSTVIDCADTIIIEDDVLISYQCLLSDSDNHSLSYTTRKNDLSAWRQGKHDWSTVESAPIRICQGAWLGARVIILKGVTVGQGAIIGAGSVVTHDIPAWCVAAGNPARVIRKVPIENIPASSQINLSATSSLSQSKAAFMSQESMGIKDVPATDLVCWCGNTSLVPFSPHYLRCPVCETLVTAEIHAPEFTAVRDDDQDFYGREYWFSHQEEDLGQANIVERARADMPERALHWLRALLKYKLPPGDVLELGSAHGGFVALLRWAGFEASGLELSPSIVEYAKQTFGVPMLLGPVEEQNIAPSSLDAIALMDVLEHLPDPLGTMRHSLSLLKPDGILLIQTPRYAEGKTFAAMEAERDPFLIQLKHEQHLYLFSHTSARELFQRLGAEHIAFEPAIFAHYDMFIAVSRAPLVETNLQERESRLLATANNRMVQALVDLDNARLRVVNQLQEADRDRDARMAVIERQGAELGRIPALEADVEFLKNQLIASEADRAARLAVIERQGAELGQVQHRLGAAERQLAEIRGLIADIRRLAGTHKREIALRALSPRTWRRVRGKVKQLLAIHALSQSSALPASSSADSSQLAQYVAKIDQFNAGQPNAQLLNAIRSYNHQMVDTLHGIVPLAGKRLLDIGASPHGYALERALTHKVAEYVGIGLDVEQPLTIRAAQGSGTLLFMDATKLDMPDNSFDLVISMSTFEHIGDVATALAEIRRVLKPGGKALLSYEPIWTCSYGHHLHHFGPIARHMPDWAHLVWDKAAMLRELGDVWPKDGVPSLQEAADWVYDSPALNRIGMQQMLQLLRESGLAIEWLTKIPDEPRSAARLKEIEQATGLSREDLIAKGLSVFLAKL
jgi:acetyltransferase-like isoleucine patch superfamily enzyme/SAM-dependent methyltransferase